MPICVKPFWECKLSERVGLHCFMQNLIKTMCEVHVVKEIEWMYLPNSRNTHYFWMALRWQEWEGLKPPKTWLLSRASLAWIDGHIRSLIQGLPLARVICNLLPPPRLTHQHDLWVETPHKLTVASWYQNWSSVIVITCRKLLLEGSSLAISLYQASLNGSVVENVTCEHGL